VDGGLAAGQLAHQALSRFGKGDDGRRGPATFGIWNDDRLAGFHDRDHRVGGAQVDAYCLCHCDFSFISAALTHGAPGASWAVDEDILRGAGTERAEAFVAVTNADTTNIMAAQLAQHEFGVKKVICRIYDPARADVYAELGLETICPTTIGADKVKRFFEK